MVNKNEKLQYNEKKLTQVNYRPFFKQWLYRDKILNWSNYLQFNIFPDKETFNPTITVTGVGAGTGFSTLMVNQPPDLHYLSTSQCFPLKCIRRNSKDGAIFSNLRNPSEIFTSNIIPKFLTQVQKQFDREEILDSHLFYYIYAILHSIEYRDKYSNNLSKELPRIPIVKNKNDFFDFYNAGLKLSELHIGYEGVDPYPTVFREGDLRFAHIDDPKSFFRVKKMKFPKKNDKSTVIYNKNITIQNIPLDAYEYVVNGKSALEWVMDRQVDKTDTKSGIKNDANDYANETMNNPAYPLELFQRIITVSLETMKIVKSLPSLDID